MHSTVYRSQYLKIHTGKQMGEKEATTGTLVTPMTNQLILSLFYMQAQCSLKLKSDMETY